MNESSQIPLELEELIFLLLEDQISNEQMDLLDQMLMRNPQARRYFIESLIIDMAFHKRIASSASILALTQDFDPQMEDLLLGRLAEYEKTAQVIQVDGGKGHKRLRKEECEKLINAFMEEEKRIKEEEKVRKEEETRAQMQEQQRIRMKEIRLRQRILQLQRAAKKT
ncbi:MAG: hypothetical protein ACYSTX_03995, partial [Planctomycetota bacterium]